MPTADLSAAFPVLAGCAYLNAGTCGPTPSASLAAVRDVIERGAREGRGLPYYEQLGATAAQARAAWAALFGASTDEIALTAGASDGLARVLGMVDWQAGDEIITTDEEHPELLGPLGALARRAGVVVQIAPWDGVAEAVSPATRLIAVSHVSWLRGAVIDLEALQATGLPIVLDGAQSAGAMPVDVPGLRATGVVAFAAAGQKWTCGPVGTGALWIDERWAPDGGVGVWPTYENLAVPSEGLAAECWPDARRFDAPSQSLEQLAGSIASLEALAGHGWDRVHLAGVDGAAAVARRLRDAGLDVLDRGDSTLVTWRSHDAQAVIDAATSADVVVRGFPGLPYVRASVGAWTTDEHLDRLLAVATG